MNAEANKKGRLKLIMFNVFQTKEITKMKKKTKWNTNRKKNESNYISNK